MTNKEHQLALELLKENLFDGLAIYHEKVTLLIKLTQFEIEETRVNFTAQIVKPLDNLITVKNRLYQKLIEKEEFYFSSSYLIKGDEDNPLLKNGKLGRPYCPFSLWLDPELSKFVFENGDEITKQIPKYILSNEDWKILKTNNKQ